MAARKSRQRRRPLSPLWIMGGIVGLIAIVGILVKLSQTPANQPAAEERPRDAAATSPRKSELTDKSKKTKSTKKRTNSSDESETVSSEQRPVRPSESPHAIPDKKSKSAKTAIVSVYTVEPGFLVEVDGVLVRDSEGYPLKTPLAVQLSISPHSFRIVRENYRDISKEIPIIENEELDFTPEYDPFGSQAGFFSSAYHLAATGTRIDLESLNSLGANWDPWLSADGLALYFCGDHAEGRGLYVSRRETIDGDFTTADQLLRTSEPLASPAQTMDGLQIAFGARQKAQIRSLIRADVAEPFRPGPTLAFSEVDGTTWPIVAISATGLAVDWMGVRSDKSTTHSAIRKTLEAAFPNKGQITTIPGGVPRYSADGLRVYWLEGSTLMRASRSNLNESFGTPLKLCTIPSDLFQVATNRRQFVLSADETWLWFDSGESGKEALYAYRIQEAPTSGLRLTGKSIAPRAMVADTMTDPNQSPAASAEAMEEAAIQPDELPLPYFAFRRDFLELLLVYDVPGASTRLKQAQTDPALQSEQQFLEWDVVELSLYEQFWQRYEKNWLELMPGDQVKAKGKKLEVVDVQGDNLHGKTTNGTTLEVAMRELSPSELLAIAERGIAKDDQSMQLSAGVFLSFLGRDASSLAQVRLQRAGERGKEVNQHRLERLLSEVRKESEAGRVGRALARIDELVAFAPKSPQAEQALLEREQLPGRLVWKPQGGQNWDRSISGVLRAIDARAAGAYLESGEDYRNFRLTMEWQTTGPTAQGGVYFRYSGTGELRKSSWRISVANDQGTVDRFSTGSLFGVKPATKNRVKPAGEWNTFDLSVSGDKARLKINGEQVLDAVLSDQNIPSKGRICLDGEFGGVSYRNVLIEPLR